MLQFVIFAGFFSQCAFLSSLFHREKAIRNTSGTEILRSRAYSMQRCVLRHNLRPNIRRLYQSSGSQLSPSQSPQFQNCKHSPTSHEARKHHSKYHKQPHAPNHIAIYYFNMGSLNPFCFAISRAFSYPASACLTIAVPGSVVSTVTTRLSASFVPSATKHMPACML